MRKERERTEEKKTSRDTHTFTLSHFYTSQQIPRENKKKSKYTNGKSDMKFPPVAIGIDDYFENMCEHIDGAHSYTLAHIYSHMSHVTAHQSNDTICL